MTYEQLITLNNIIETGSFKAAASKMHKAQPSISNAIKNLECELGIELFDRSEYRPKLTQKGRAIYSLSKIIESDFIKLENLAQKLKDGASTTTKLSVDAVFPYTKLQCIMDQFVGEFELSDIDLSIDVLEGSEQKVLEGIVDFGISPFLSPNSKIFYEPLTNVEMIPVIHKDLACKINFDWKRLLEVPQIVVMSTSTTQSNTQFGLLEGGKKWRLNDNSAKQDLIKNAMGWGRLPSHQVRESINNGNLILIQDELVDKFVIPIYLIRKKNSVFGPTTHWLWNKIINEFKSD